MLYIHRTPRPTLLVVDDDRQQLDLCATVLRSAGFAVMTASCGQEALQILAEDAIDAAILDYEMPDLNGSALANEIRRRYPRIRILLYSGATNIPGRELVNVDAFVPKGTGPASLIVKVLELGRGPAITKQDRINTACSGREPTSIPAGTTTSVAAIQSNRMLINRMQVPETNEATNTNAAGTGERVERRVQS